MNDPLVDALGFKAPPKKAKLIGPVTGNVEIFNDYPAPGLLSGAYMTGGDLDFYSTKAPATGKYAILWSGGEHYNSFSFSFASDRDFSLLRDSCYALEFLVRIPGKTGPFEVRFVNPGTLPADLPWRSAFQVDASLAPADGKWHKVRIPLSEMRETGAWKEAWFPAEGKFSWTRISRLEFVAEEQSLSGSDIWFDDIRITR